ncbi:gamma-glutamylcyclotransferase [Ancylomarina sp. DW003]|nr:gamma-glutamylcyclotransferase family protein [Ancylomarina sp. DW003]MDE5422843.1 gamma-glutamylcyclotransferase [Ancylomarina sp. DW003]
MVKLFSYGTLQFEQVQLDTFGRKLSGEKDLLRSYKVTKIKITDPKVIKSSGTDMHPMLEYTGNENDFVEGTVFEISEEELMQADSYEVDDYRRAELIFASGESAYVYLKR